MAPMTPVSLTRHTLEMIESGMARRLREESRTDLMSAGRACNVYPSTVLRWERGERLPRGRNLAAYGRFLARLATQEQA